MLLFLTVKRFTWDGYPELSHVKPLCWIIFPIVFCNLDVSEKGGSQEAHQIWWFTLTVPYGWMFFRHEKASPGPLFLKHRQIEAGFSTISENPISMFEKFQWFFNGRSSELVWYLFSIFQNKKGELVGDRNSNIIGCQISESNIWWSHVYIYMDIWYMDIYI